MFKQFISGEVLTSSCLSRKVLSKFTPKDDWQLCLTAVPGVVSSIPARPNTFVREIELVIQEGFAKL